MTTVTQVADNSPNGVMVFFSDSPQAYLTVHRQGALLDQTLISTGSNLTVIPESAIATDGSYQVHISDGTTEYAEVDFATVGGNLTADPVLINIGGSPMATALPTPAPGAAPTVNHKPYTVHQRFLDDSGHVASVTGSGGTQAEAENYVDAIMLVQVASADPLAVADLRRTLTVDLGQGITGGNFGTPMDAILRLFRPTDRAKVNVKISNMATTYLLSPARSALDINNADLKAIATAYRDRYDVGGFILVGGNSEE